MPIFRSNKSSSLGARGEKAAAEYLKKCGYKILDLNFCNKSGRRLGEIDIVAKDGDEIVFVEVKTRKIALNNQVVLPEENITRDKLYKLNKAATFYINKFDLHSAAFRFDAITLLANPDNTSAKLKHIKNIFF